MTAERAMCAVVLVFLAIIIAILFVESVVRDDPEDP